MEFFKYLLYFVHAVSCLLLIALVVMQTSKAEGLGAVGGSSGPSLRGRAGFEEQLSQYTKYSAFAFMGLSALLYILAQKFHWS